jgi:hypothetical protein
MANYTLIEKITVGAAGASSVTFSGIPQTGYTDLVIKCSVRSDRASSLNSYMRLYPNGSSTGITLRALTGNGSSAGSQTESAAGAYVGEINAITSTASTFSSIDIYLPNYAGSTNKSYSVDAVMENNATTAYAALVADLWSNTSAITSLQLLDALGNFVQGSTFYLYGVAKLGTTPAIVPYATGGDTIMTDGTYWYHAFKSSGTFTPAKGLSCDVLVVAGGGGGSGGYGAGGGAGGYRSATAQTVSSAITVTVGAGGAGGANANNTGTNGSNSSFSSFASTGGGGAGIYQPPTGVAKAGGSGGGAGGGDVSGGTGGAGNLGGYSPVEGYAGGDGRPAGGASSGGGGGAGAVGQNSVSSSQSGAGGAGSNAHSSWLSVVGLGVSGFLAGGGGGGGVTSACTAGAGGSGGGSAGSTGGNASNATANTGGGAGGGGATGGITYSGGQGGSGLVIVRYAV